MADIRLLYVTCPDRETALGLARALVERRLAACGNVLPGATSVYRWEGRIETADEVVLILKTHADRLAEAMETARTLHPYDMPCVVALAPEAADARFAAWARDQTRPG